MNLLDRVIAEFSPQRAVARVRARKLLKVLSHYDAATSGRRVGSLRAAGTDADAAAAQRKRMAFLSRDLVRNTPFAARAQAVITNAVVGDGIVPRISGLPPELQSEGLALIERVLDRTMIDAAGRVNLYGLQRLGMNATVDAGEVLVVVRWQKPPYDANNFPLQLSVLEPDYLDDSLDNAGQEGGFWVRNGIKYDADGRRVAYRLFHAHPGSDQVARNGVRSLSEWVPASQVLHIFRQDRPGQERGVTWFAPVVLTFGDFADYQDAQIMRQKVAACFAGFRRLPDTMPDADKKDRVAEMDSGIEPGLIQDLYGDEDIIFSNPPDVGGYEEFTKVTLRAAAAALGMTYEALTGDLSNVNFSSARMGRMEMDRNVSSWQWTMLIPQMMQPLESWLLQAWALWRPDLAAVIKGVRFDWVPPTRILVDPAREIPALAEAVRAGFTSRSDVVRGFGVDPERLLEQQAKDQVQADALGLVFDSDARVTSAGGKAAERPPQDAAGKDNADGQ